jgi:hypothetical protein
MRRKKASPLSLRANGSRECAPDDRLREAIRDLSRDWIASSLLLLAMMAARTTVTISLQTSHILHFLNSRLV